ncbi:cellulose binding domain-containing protein [Actinoplanes derwentensis]|uniref:Cellulose binding domain-containing protein n=1 Tax=Actinoplanes derwentensis TaxID=113562 RepID=A0A1H2D9V1_9ACTN|nr:cellulose binding domain-containing protein [Actinoplanes derwentensis]GID81581.1 hypothetical protein Ade03nite_05050 [Actinoplanes derwentensis]SDT79357.1 Cellulose binding domain-containing protein [Actinoplanes derwentensis]
MTEPPRGVRPDTADLQKMGESSTPYDPGDGTAWQSANDKQDYAEYGPEQLPARRPGETLQRIGPDLMDRRYDALAAWNESAQTMTMAAIGDEPRPAYPQSFDPDSFRDAVPQHSVPPARTVRRALRARRERIAAGVVGVALLGAGTAVAWGSAGEPGTPVATGTAVAVRTTEADPGDGVEPVATGDTEPSSTPSAGAATSASPVPSPSVSSRPRRIVTLPAVRNSRGPSRTSVGPTAGSPALSASYEYDSGAGSVRVANTGDADATDWTVGLTVPGGETVTVTSGDVVVVQSGSSVTFRPSGARVPPAGLVAFSFAVDPVPAEEPGGCTIDGSSCG